MNAHQGYHTAITSESSDTRGPLTTAHVVGHMSPCLDPAPAHATSPLIQGTPPPASLSRSLVQRPCPGDMACLSRFHRTPMSRGGSGIAAHPRDAAHPGPPTVRACVRDAHGRRGDRRTLMHAAGAQRPCALPDAGTSPPLFFSRCRRGRVSVALRDAMTAGDVGSQDTGQGKVPYGP